VPGGRLSLALLEPVDPSHAHRPRNDSERLLFRNLYPNLIRLDCHGVARPALAESWVRDSAGAWTFTLREGFQSDEAARALAAVPVLSGPTGIDSIRSLGPRQLRVHLTNAGSSAIQVLADPSLALVDTTPLGASTGSVRVPSRGALPAMELTLFSQGDPRDVLDRGVDLIVTRDPSLIEYAAGRPELRSFSLPWTRTYVLVQAPGAQPLSAAIADSERSSLARDAVPADARPAEPLDWWTQDRCPTAAPEAARSIPSKGVAYLRGDDVARAVAERMVAVAGPEAGLRTVALDPDAFRAALQGQSQHAFVVALPRQTLMPCRELADLPKHWAALPLVDTRAHAIVRKGSPPLGVDWDGTVRLLEP
jgi:hypothetical protein